jgi:hypothetical protein
VAHTNYKTSAMETISDKRIHFRITIDWERGKRRANANKKRKKELNQYLELLASTLQYHSRNLLLSQESISNPL